MGKVEDGQKILAALGLPRAQHSPVASFTLLALVDVTKRTPWAGAKRRSLRIHDIIQWLTEKHDKAYAENSRETIRRQVLHQLVQARVVDRNPDEPGLSTNSPRTHYAITDEALAVVRAFGTKAFTAETKRFLAKQGALLAVYRAEREGRLVPVTLASGLAVNLSPGKHNVLQKAIVEEFAPRFAAGAFVLYLGDTAKKHTLVETKALELLQIPVTKHDKLPDVVLHLPSRNWLFLIEAVTSHGPVSPKRKFELEDVLQHCPLSRVYVSAFPDLKTFKKYVPDIAWETEVWIADPALKSHMIHFNGDKFLGPAS